MQQLQTIGIDLAKNVFQVHGVDESDGVVVVKQLRRSQVIPVFSNLEPYLVQGYKETSAVFQRR